MNLELASPRDSQQLLSKIAISRLAVDLLFSTHFFSTMTNSLQVRRRSISSPAVLPFLVRILIPLATTITALYACFTYLSNFTSKFTSTQKRIEHANPDGKSEKRPKHIAISFKSPIAESTSNALSRDIRNLLDGVVEATHWCIEAGAEVLTVFDDEGVLKDHAIYLREQLDQCSSESRPISSNIEVYLSGERFATLTCDVKRDNMAIVEDEGIDVDSVSTSSGESSTGMQQRHESIGSHDGSGLRLNVISSFDGRAALVRVAQKLATQSLQLKQTDNSDSIHSTIDVELVDRMLREGNTAWIYCIALRRKTEMLIAGCHRYRASTHTRA